MSERGLTPKQQRFVEEYLVDLNASAAAVRAGYSARFINANASKLLQNTAVAAAISSARSELSTRTKRTVDDVMEDIRRRGRLAEDAEDYGPALKAAELEGRHLGAFEQDNKQRNPLGSFDPSAFFADIFRRPES